MNILVFTNTFTPHVGGVARSVQQFTDAYRSRGHAVLVVAPEFPQHVDHEDDVVRMPAIQNFNGSDFSVAVPVPGYLTGVVRDFQPHIVHSHHPFILGDTALRFSAKYALPIVFTHHTQYEKYTHYVPGDSPAMKRFAIDLAVGYCNLCDTVIAPSATIRDRLVDQGVEVPIEEIPTGVDTELFGSGDAAAMREKLGIPPQRFVVGHVGRLAPEKGLEFLASTVAQFIGEHEDACFVVAGSGPCVDPIKRIFAKRKIADRLIIIGQLDRLELASVYTAMDVFAFASQSETQGMVLTEAMAAGIPVVAVDAPGVREVLRSCINGISLEQEDTELFVQALHTVARLTPNERQALTDGAKQTAEEFSIEKTTTTALELYARLIEAGTNAARSHDAWSVARRRIEKEWAIWSNVAEAISHAVN
jgi:glycosyltransferase involved in cell wall biosynthesis